MTWFHAETIRGETIRGEIPGERFREETRRVCANVKHGFQPTRERRVSEWNKKTPRQKSRFVLWGLKQELDSDTRKASSSGYTQPRSR